MFTAHLGTYWCTRTPFDIRNSPAAFPRALDIILSGVWLQAYLIYSDDFTVFSKIVAQHITYLDTVFTFLPDTGTLLELKKCFFFTPQIDYLRHLIESGRLSVAQKATKASQTFDFRYMLAQLRFFVGACNVYRGFVKDFSETSRPLTDMTRKDASPDFTNPISRGEAIDVPQQ